VTASAGPSTRTRRVAILARAPSSPGKSRLTANLLPARAVALRQALLLDTVTAAQGAACPLTIFVTPATGEAEVRGLVPGDVDVRPQAEGDLGMRMHATIATLLGEGASAVVLIGSDLPTLPPPHLLDAFAVLEAGSDVVFGPAEDGGYYLVGMTRPTPAVFDGIEWGDPGTWAATEAAVTRAQLTMGRVSPWYDVDRPDDLSRLAASEAPAPRTRAWLATRTTKEHIR
jgi:uncharacterized protein